MKRTLLRLFLVILAIFCAGATLSAQQMGPPKVLQIIREDVKVGKAAGHVKVEAGYVAAFAKAKWPTRYLAAASMTGPSEAWFFVPYDSFEAWEKDAQATDQNAALTADLDKLGEQDAGYINNVRSIVARYRPELSYRPNANVGEFHYFEADLLRVRLGHGDDFDKLVKVSIEAHEKLNIDEHWVAYEVVEGMPSGTILFLTPMKSLKQADSDHGKQVAEAMGEENARKFAQFSREGIIVDESNLFAFSPKMSYPSEQTIAGDPAFWKPKAGGMAPAAGAGEAGKTAPPAKKAPGKQPPKQ
jgi:hypothetical protein